MRKLFFVPAFLLILPLIIFVLAGTPFVIGLVKQKVEQAVGDNLGIPLRIGSVSGNLFFVLHATDIEAPGLGRIAELKVNYNAFGLLSRHVDVRSARIEGIELDVDCLVRVLGNVPKKGASQPSKSPPFRIQVESFSISDGGVGLKLGENPLNVVISAHGMLLQDRLVVDSLHALTRRSTVVLKGIVPLAKAADLNVDFDIDLTVEDLGLESLSGVLVSTGTVKGKFSSPVIKALTRINARIMENDVKGVVDLAWRIPFFDSLAVEGDLSLTTATLQTSQKGKGEYDTWDIMVLLDRKRISAELLSRYGRARVNGIIMGKITRPDIEANVSGRFDYQGFKPSFEGHVQYTAGILRIPDFKLENRRVKVDLALSYDQKKKRISDAELSVYCRDLGVMRSIIAAPEDLSGELWLDVEGSGTVENFDAVARLRLSELVAFGEFINTAHMLASMKNTVVQLDSGTIESARGVIGLHGYYDTENNDFALQINSEGLTFQSPEVFGVDTLMLGGSVGVNLMFSGDIQNPRGQGEIVFSNIVYDTLQLGVYALDFVLADTTLQMSLADEHNTLMLGAEARLIGDFPFSATAQIRHFALDRFTSPATGRVTADLVAKGSLSDLRRTAASLHIDAVELNFENNRLHNIDPIDVEIENMMVKLHKFTLGLAGQKIHLQGTLPIDFEGADMDISGMSSDIQLSEVADFLPGVPPIAGRLNFDMRIQGTPRRLDIDGNLILEDANYVIKDVIFDSVSARFLFKNGVLTCKDLTGRINKGRFEANGFADLSRGRLDTLSLEIELKRIDYANKDFGRMLVDADLQAAGWRDSLRINGEIVVVEGVYDAPMKLQTFVKLLTNANRPGPQQPEIAKRVYCDIGITVPDSIVIANNVADLAVRADLQLKGYLARLNAYGTISAINEGTVKYLGRNFTIVNAVIQFDDPYKIDPVIDLTATTTIGAADGDYEIFLRLDGTVTTWQLGLSSNPPLPQQDIVSLLLIGQRRPGEVGTTVKEIDVKGKAKDYALDAVRYGIEKSGERLLGLDRFTITGELDDPSSVTIGIEKSIAKGFTLLYTTGIESWELHQVGASYDVTDHISIFTLHDQENLNTSVDLDFHFNIR